MAVNFSETIEVLPAEESEDMSSDSDTSGSAEGIASLEKDYLKWFLEVRTRVIPLCELETSLLRETHFYFLTKT